MTGCEKFLKILKVIGNIASTILKGMEEYRRIKDQERFYENQRRRVKYLPGPKNNRRGRKKRQR